MDIYLLPLLGGTIIGVAASLMLLLNGRVLGVSGIVLGSLKMKRRDFLWRILFIAGLIMGGFTLKAIFPQAMELEFNRSLTVIAISGLLVGFGTAMGSGCTSGHGICGISRFSFRSIIATFTFMIAGILAATLFQLLRGAS